MNNQSNPLFFHRWIPTVIGVIIVVLIGGGVIAYNYLWTPQPVELPTAGEKKEPDQTVGWKTYKNEEYGYEMKYPKNWSAKHESGYNEVLERYYEKNIFKDPTGKYILYFGIVPEDSNIRTPNLKTGVGFTQVGTDQTINIGGRAVKISNLIYEPKGTVQEVWFGPFEINDFKGKAEFGYLTDDFNYNEWFDMAGKPELEIAKKILSTFRFIETDQTADWKTYRNEEYGFEIVLSEGYEGFWTKERTIRKEREMDSPFVVFYLDASGSYWPNQEFDVFGVIIYPLEKWNSNAEIDENNMAWIMGEEDSPSSFLGFYLGKNNKHAFTWSKGHDCPYYTSGQPTPLCKLYEEVSSLMKTFSVFDI